MVWFAAHAAFTLTFDEFGTGFVTQNGVTTSDNGVILNGFLAYRLPEAVDESRFHASRTDRRTTEMLKGVTRGAR